MATEAQLERKRAKVDKALSVLRGSSGEPIVTPEDYRVKITRALSWYNSNDDLKSIRKHALAYVKHINRTEALYSFTQASDHELRQVGIIGRLIMRGQYVSDNDIQTINEKIDIISSKYIKSPEEIKVKNDQELISIQDRIQELALKCAGEIDERIDEFIKNKSSDFSTKNYLLSNSISGAVAKRIAEYYQPFEKELTEAIGGKDEQLNEGYSYFTKQQLKRFYEFIKSIIADCEQQVVSVKSNRTIRKKKPVPPSKIVQKLKYMKESIELNLKSIVPTDIIGSSELWVYNTKYRKLTVYKGALSVKGTSIIGYEISGSDTKLIRKPEEFFRGIQIGKRALNSKFKEINAKVSTPNGRINDDCILIGAFK